MRYPKQIKRTNIEFGCAFFFSKLEFDLFKKIKKKLL